MTYVKLKLLVVFFVLSVLLGGLWADHYPHHDFYPFFSWSLFSNSSNSDTSYFIKLKTYGGVADNTVLYADNVSKYVEGYFLPDFYWDVQEFAVNPQIQKKIESSFAKKPVDYYLIKADYDAVVLRTTGNLIDTQVVSEHTVK